MNSFHEIHPKEKFENQVANVLREKIVMLVEDEEISMVFLGELFESKCKQIFKSTDGLSAVETMREHPEINLILMDIKMPKMDGYLAISKIREFNKKVVIIAQTAYAFLSDQEKAIQVGANDYISKPIIMNELYSIIMKHLQ